jgi:hypothetical protein
MPYAAVEARRAVQRSHYARNKPAYNPGREVARAAYKAARAELLALSDLQWVSPPQARCIVDERVYRQYLSLDDDRSFQDLEPLVQAAGIYKLAATWCFQTLPGCLEGGLICGSSPFYVPTRFGKRPEEPWNDWARDEFLKRMPKNYGSPGETELLILNITLKRIKLYGR